MAGKSAGSTRKTVVLTTDVRVSPSSSRIDAMFVRHCRVWPMTSGAAHSPTFPPGRMGAWAEMKTSPFATTQCEYGPRGFGCFGRSGTAFTIVPRRQRRGDQKRFRPGRRTGASTAPPLGHPEVARKTSYGETGTLQEEEALRGPRIRRFFEENGELRICF